MKTNLRLGGLGAALGQKRCDAASAPRSWTAGGRAEIQQLRAVVISDAPSVELARIAASQAWVRYRGRHADEATAVLFASCRQTEPALWSPAAWLGHQIVGAARVRQAAAASTLCGGSGHLLANAARLLATEDDLSSVLCVAADVFDASDVNRWEFDTDVTLGDGAGAAVVSRRYGDHVVRSVAEDADVSLEVLQRGEQPVGVRPTEPAQVRSRLKEAVAGGALSVEDVMTRHRDLVHRTVSRALTDAQITAADVSWWCLPFVGARAARHGYLEALDIAADQTVWELGLELGHLGGADGFVALNDVERSGQARAGDYVVVVSVGAGQTCSVAVVQW